MIRKHYDFDPKRLIEQIRDNAEDCVLKAAIVLQGAIKIRMGGHGLGKSGRPSPPGQSPAVQTGALRRSIQVDTKDVAKRLTAHVGSALPYARIQEFGGTIKAKKSPYLFFRMPDGSFRRVKSVRLPARPYMRPGLKKAKAGMLKAFDGLLKGIRP